MGFVGGGTERLCGVEKVGQQLAEVLHELLLNVAHVLDGCVGLSVAQAEHRVVVLSCSMLDEKQGWHHGKVVGVVFP